MERKKKPRSLWQGQEMKSSQTANISKDPFSAAGKSPLATLEPSSEQEGAFKGNSPSMKYGEPSALLGAESACGLNSRVPTRGEDSRSGTPTGILIEQRQGRYRLSPTQKPATRVGGGRLASLLSAGSVSLPRCSAVKIACTC